MHASVKPEWIVSLSVDASGTLEGVLSADGRRYKLRRGDLARLRDAIRADLVLFAGRRNAHDGEMPRASADLSGAARRIGTALGREVFSQVAAAALEKLRVSEGRFVFVAPQEIQDLPWELLIVPHDTEPLAVKPGVEMVRRMADTIATPPGPIPPPPLRIAFVAASPEPTAAARPEHWLDYQKELAILAEAVRPGAHGRGLPASCAPAIFQTDWASTPATRACLEDNRAQVLHITGHASGGLVTLETDTGEPRAVSGDVLYSEALVGARDLRLVVLSQCETAAPVARESVVSAAASLARRLPLVVGMQWPVSSEAAIQLTRALYAELARHPDDPVAALSRARHALYVWSTSPGSSASCGAEWATPVFYVGPPPVPSMAASDLPSFLPDDGTEVLPEDWQPILTSAEFVGRRREFRALLQALSGSEPFVQLIGPGGLGKSTLAAHACKQLRAHGVHIAVLWGTVTAGQLFATLVELVERACDAGLLADSAPRLRYAVEHARAQSDDGMAARIRRFIGSVRADLRILLVLDDFEQNLEPPGEAAEVVIRDPELARVLATVGARGLGAEKATAIQVLATSRWPAAQLGGARVEIQPFHSGEWLCLLERMERRFGTRLDLDDAKALHRQFAGVPRLLELFFAYYSGHLQHRIRGKHRTVASYLEGLGPPPSLDRLNAAQWAAFEVAVQDSLLLDMLAAFDGSRKVNLAALSPAVDWLRRSAVHVLPVAEVGFLALATNALPEPVELLGRACALGVVLRGAVRIRDEGTHAEDEPWYIVHPALVGLFEQRCPLSAGVRREIHVRAAAYYAHRDDLGRVSTEDELLAWHGHAIEGGRPDLAVMATNRLARKYERFGRWAEAVAVLRRVVGDGTLPTGSMVPLEVQLGQLLMRMGQVAEGEAHLRRASELSSRPDATHAARAFAASARADTLKARGNPDEALRILCDEALPIHDRFGDVRARAVTKSKIADILMARGELGEALRIFREEALPVFSDIDDVHSRAAILGKIASIMSARGELDEALRIRREEELPVYDKLGDVHSRAATLSKIADILSARGQLGEALRILRDEALPVFVTLGDVRERAVTMSKIADIHLARGQPDEALRILRDEALPAYDELGEVRERAVTMSRIADIHMARGQLDEALRLLSEEALPVYEKLADVHSRAVTVAKIADIRRVRGQPDEALRILREEALPAFDKLGDMRSRAVALGKIADILKASGQLDEALRIRREEELPVYEKVGDIHARAVTMGKIADTFRARGEPDEALRILREEVLPIHESAGDVRERAMTVGKIADILAARGELDEALRILREEALPVFDKLGDVRSHAVTMGKIADILMARGELDEALRIRREEELPVFEQLGEVRERAVTMGKIADILMVRGQLDEALRILREEALPIYDRLGQIHSRAAIMTKIADILVALGDLDEAHRILRDEALPVFEKLGDVHSRAEAMGRVADILMARGRLDEALRILRDEVLPVHDRLSDVRARAMTLGKIANILMTRGDLGEAFRILRDEVLPVFDKLGDVHSRAVTLGEIAGILTARGQLDEALRILREEALPAYDKLGDVRARALTMGEIADVLMARGEPEEALRALREEALPAYNMLGDVHSRAVTMSKIAHILMTSGQLDEALRIFREESLPVFDRLGDVRSRALSMGKIADILTARGQLDEALRILREEELPVYESLGDVRSRAVALGRLANILTGRGELDEALRILRDEALPVFEKLGDESSLAACLHTMGIVQANMGRLDAATRLFEESAERQRRIGERGGAAANAAMLARVYLAQGNPERAQHALDSAVAAFRSLRDPYGEAQCLRLAVPLLYGGDREGDALLALGRAGWLMRSMGRPEAAVFDAEFAEARKAIEQAAVGAALAGEDGVASRYLLGVVALADGDLEGARARFVGAKQAADGIGASEYSRSASSMIAIIERAFASDTPEAAMWEAVGNRFTAGFAWAPAPTSIPVSVASLAKAIRGADEAALEAVGRKIAQTVSTQGAEPLLAVIDDADATVETAVATTWQLCAALEAIRVDAWEQTMAKLSTAAARLLDRPLGADAVLVCLDGLARATLQGSVRGNAPLLSLLRARQKRLAEARESAAVRAVRAVVRTSG